MSKKETRRLTFYHPSVQVEHEESGGVVSVTFDWSGSQETLVDDSMSPIQGDSELLTFSGHFDKWLDKHHRPFMKVWCPDDQKVRELIEQYEHSKTRKGGIPEGDQEAWLLLGYTYWPKIRDLKEQVSGHATEDLKNFTIRVLGECFDTSVQELLEMTNERPRQDNL